MTKMEAEAACAKDENLRLFHVWYLSSFNGIKSFRHMLTPVAAGAQAVNFRVSFNPDVGK